MQINKCFENMNWTLSAKRPRWALSSEPAFVGASTPIVINLPTTRYGGDATDREIQVAANATVEEVVTAITEFYKQPISEADRAAYAEEIKTGLDISGELQRMIRSKHCTYRKTLEGLKFAEKLCLDKTDGKVYLILGS